MVGALSAWCNQYPHPRHPRSGPARLVDRLKKPHPRFRRASIQSGGSWCRVHGRSAEHLATRCRDGGVDQTSAGDALSDGGLIVARSEEHTSELKSLMRSSYDVFCLNKKNNAKQIVERISHSP